jgi:hypothetical protein
MSARVRYDWDDIRFSVSWKAYCYADDPERRIAAEHTDDLSRAQIMEALLAGGLAAAATAYR